MSKNENYQEEDFKPYFKNTCMMCGKSIRTTWKTFQKRGNYCVACCVRATRDGEEHYAETIKILRELL